MRTTSFFLLIAAAISLPLLGVAVVGVVAAADKKDAPTGEKVHGTLVSKTDNTLTVRAEGEQAAHRYIFVTPGAQLDAKSAAFFRGIAVGSEVELTLRPDRRNVSFVLVLAGPGKFGLLAGTVTGKSSGGIEIKDDQGKTDRYMPHWNSKQGVDKDMSQAIAQRNIGDRVEIRWVDDHGLRLNAMRLLALAPNATAPPGGEGGTVVGNVVEKGKDWLAIKSAEGPAQRYLPQRVIGGRDELDKDILRAIAKARVGSRVEAMWFRDGERRMYSLKPAVAAP